MQDSQVHPLSNVRFSDNSAHLSIFNGFQNTEFTLAINVNEITPPEVGGNNAYIKQEVSFETTDEFVTPFTPTQNLLSETDTATSEFDASWKDFETNSGMNADSEKSLISRGPTFFHSTTNYDKSMISNHEKDDLGINEKSVHPNEVMKTKNQNNSLDHFYQKTNFLLGKENSKAPESAESDSNRHKYYCPKCNKNAVPIGCYTGLNKCSSCREVLLYECVKCNMKYKTISGLTYHFQSKCYQEEIFTCDVCNYETKSKFSIERHMKSHSDDEFQLSDDNSTDDTESDSATDEDFVEKTRKRSHSITRLIEQYCSKCCKLTTSNISDKDISCQKCQTPILWQCKTCKKRFGQYYAILWHLQYRCSSSASNESLVKKSDYNNNSKRKRQKIVTCENCGKSYKNEGSLKSHQYSCRKSIVQF